MIYRNQSSTWLLCVFFNAGRAAVSDEEVKPRLELYHVCKTGLWALGVSTESTDSKGLTG